MNFRILTRSDLVVDVVSIFQQGSGSATAFGVSLDLQPPSSSDITHYAIVRSGSTVSLYKNGILSDSQTGSSSDFTYNSMMNRNGQYGDSPGLMELKIISTGLTASQISEDYENPQQTLPDGVSQSSLLRHYRLSETNTPNNGIILDYSDNKAHGIFYTNATQPSNAAVIGIEKGYQTAKGNFNRYPSLDGIDDNIDTGLDESGLGLWEIRFVVVDLPTTDGNIMTTDRLDIGNEMRGIWWRGTQGATGQFRLKTKGSASYSEILWQFTSPVHFAPDGVNIGDVIHITQNVTADTHSSTVTNETTGYTATISKVIDNTQITSISKRVTIGSTPGNQLYQKFIPINEVVNGQALSPANGWNNGTLNGSPSKINIYGEDNNSTTDIFGNGFQYPWNEGILNFVGANHEGVSQATFPDVSGGGFFAFWHLPVTDAVQRIFELSSNNPSMLWASGSYGFLPDNDVIVSGKDKTKWNFIAVDYAQNGDYDVYWGDIDTPPTLVNSLNMSTAWATTSSINIGIRSNGLNPVVGLMGPDFHWSGNGKTLQDVIDLYNSSKSKIE